MFFFHLDGSRTLFLLLVRIRLSFVLTIPDDRQVPLSGTIVNCLVGEIGSCLAGEIGSCLAGEIESEIGSCLVGEIGIDIWSWSIVRV